MRSTREGSIVFGIALAIAACLGACEADESTENESDPPAAELDPATATRLDERPCPDDNDLSYEGFGAPFIFTWCNGCHASGLPDGERQGAPLGIDFDDLDAIRRHAARIWARSGDHNVTMPPVAGPDEADRADLGAWLACGAPALADLP